MQAAGAFQEPNWEAIWFRVGIAAILAGQGMVFSLAVNLTPPEGRAYWIVHGGLIGSAVVVFLLLGGPLLRESWAAWREWRVTVDSLFLVTLAGAFVASLLSTLTRTGAVYYEVVAIVLAIYTVGKALGARSRTAALREIRRLRADLATAELAESGGPGRSVPAASLQPGMRVLVGPGSLFTVDGRIVGGRGFVREMAMTGEPGPVHRREGDRVLAGMESLDGTFVVEVVKATGRRLDEILEVLERARLGTGRLQEQADRMIGWFLPGVLAVAAGTFAFWFWRTTWPEALFNSMAVLLVACPCALGLATPMALWSGLFKLSRLGLVAGAGDFLDRLSTVSRVVFDKTGTLCEEELALERFTPGSRYVGREEWLKAVAVAVERGNPHPLARSVAAAFGDNGAAAVEVEEARLRPGEGVTAVIRSEGGPREVCLGAPSLLSGAGQPPEPPGGEAPGSRRLVLGIDGEAAAWLDFREKPRAEVPEVLAELKALGLECEILTGDRAFQADVFAGATGRTGLVPEAKAARVRELQDSGERVLAVGDGINDTPALALADASIAMGGGAPLARSTATAVLGGGSLRAIPRAIRLAREIRQGILTNMYFAAGYNVIGMILAAGGILHPVVAALLMLGSSAMVSARALRIGRVEETPAHGADGPSSLSGLQSTQERIPG